MESGGSELATMRNHGVIYYGSAEEYDNGGWMGTVRDYPTAGEFAADVSRECDYYLVEDLRMFEVKPIWIAWRAFVNYDGRPVVGAWPYPRSDRRPRGGTPGWRVTDVTLLARGRNGTH